MSAKEILALQKKLSIASYNEQPLSAVVQAGGRLYQWIDRINEGRPADQKISLSSAGATLSYPMEAPSIYNPQIILSKFQQALDACPLAMKQILLGQSETPNDTTLSNEQFIKYGLPVSRAYDLAVRWNSLSPYRNYYSRRQSFDVRGHYFLSRIPDIQTQLKNWKTLNAEQATRYKQWLAQMCMNSNPDASLNGCQAKVQNKIDDDQISEAYNLWLPDAKKTYDEFFEMAPDLVRHDIFWSAQIPEQMQIPFLRPSIEVFAQFLQKNVEEEFRYGSWQLKIVFTDDDSRNPSRLEFQPGVTDHVEYGLIVMDQNAPLSEYLTNWAIRHEFGHILGFEDCYLEFYDPSMQAMINYQIDVQNLMCSRQGRFLPIHYEKLKRQYYKDH